MAIVSYLWSFGDGSTSTEESPQHNYERSGKYTWTLQTTDDAGTVETYTGIINVYPIPLNPHVTTRSFRLGLFQENVKQNVDN